MSGASVVDAVSVVLESHVLQISIAAIRETTTMIGAGGVPTEGHARDRDKGRVCVRPVVADEGAPGCGGGVVRKGRVDDDETCIKARGAPAAATAPIGGIDAC